MARRRYAPKPTRHPVGRRPIREPGDERGPLARSPQNQPGGPAGAPPEPLDWLGIPGLPADVQNAIDAIFRDGAPNAEQRALAYVRTTAWYAAEYRGIGAGVAKGVIGGEADYRAYKNQVQQTYRKFYGRDVTNEEIESFLNQGYNPTTVEQIGQGTANVAAHGAEWQYLGGAFSGGQFSAQELQALGEQQAGRDTALGGTIQAKVQSALAKVARVFEGQLASTPSLLGQEPGKKRPDIGA